MAKNDVSAGESNKKNYLDFLLWGTQRYWNWQSIKNVLEFYALKRRNYIIVIPDFSKISTCWKQRLYEGVQ